MKYVVDRIEGNIAVLEELETKTKKEIPLTELSFSIREGNIISEDNNEYILDLNTEKMRREKLRNRFNKLKKRDY